MNKLPLINIPNTDRYFFVITRGNSVSSDKYSKVITFKNIHSSDYDNLPNNNSELARLYTGLVINVSDLSTALVFSEIEDNILSYNPMPNNFIIALNSYTDRSTWKTTIKATYNINHDRFLLAFDENDTLCLYIQQTIAACYFDIKIKDITIIDVDEKPNNYIYTKEELNTVDCIIIPEFEVNNSMSFMFDSNFYTPNIGNIYHLYKSINNDIVYIKVSNKAYGVKLYKTDEELNFNGTSSNRPKNLDISCIGFQYFDTTLNKPIWWTGTKWVDSTGSDV